MALALCPDGYLYFCCTWCNKVRVGGLLIRHRHRHRNSVCLFIEDLSEKIHTSILSQWLLHRMAISSVIFTTGIHTCQTSTLSQGAQYLASILSDKCAQGKWSLHFTWGEMLSRLSLGYTSMAKNADQWKWRHIRISMVTAREVRRAPMLVALAAVVVTVSNPDWPRPIRPLVLFHHLI